MNSSLLNLASLELALRVVAVAQFAVAILNLFLIRIMKWKPDLERAPLIIREVFRIHVVFISITLSIFAALTWRFAYEIARASSPLTIWLAVAIGLFWLVRSAMQWLHSARAIGMGVLCERQFIGRFFSATAQWRSSTSRPRFGERDERGSWLRRASP